MFFVHPLYNIIIFVIIIVIIIYAVVIVAVAVTVARRPVPVAVEFVCADVVAISETAIEMKKHCLTGTLKCLNRKAFAFALRVW